MPNTKLLLLAATAASGLAATSALAQSNYAILSPGLSQSTVTTGSGSFTYDGDTALHGAGATSPQNIVVRVLNCLGTPYKLGNGQPGQGGNAATSGSLSAKVPGVYAGTPSLTCNNTSANVAFTGGSSTYEIQPQTTTGFGFAGKYVGAGSGFGRKIWYYFADVFDGGANANAVSHVYNPFNLVAGDNRWSHVQFALSDTPIAQSELNTYNAAGNAAASAGPAIQFPLFVIPVAIAFDPTYGVNASGQSLVFNFQFSGNFAGTSLKSLRLNAQAYCGIFNGDITNWNDPQLQALNKKIALFDTANDTAARWKSDGVPIRLAGRLDTSGNTDAFTRHLAAVCSQSAIYTPKTAGGTNKYLNHAESLPYNSAQNGGVDYTSVRSDSNLKPASNGNTAKLAGTTNAVSGDYFNGTKIVNINPGVAISGAPTAYTGSGLFTVTNGNTNLAKLITLAPDLVEADGFTLNGKIGYISADYIQPSVDAPGGLVGALLAIQGTTFVAPTFKTALTAFGSVLPPESDSTGAYTAGSDTRTVNLPGSGTGPATRSNPIAWTDVLYQTGATLAQPSAGYPITGTDQFYGYTCYATPGNREAIEELLGTLLGQIRKDATGTAIAAGAFDGAVPANPGIVDQSNLGIVPKAWQVAIANTYLSNTGDANALNLWIQSALLPSVKTKKGVTTVTRPTANTTVCGSLVGA